MSKTGTHVAEKHMSSCFIKDKQKERIFDLKIQKNKNARDGLFSLWTMTDRLFIAAGMGGIYGVKPFQDKLTGQDIVWYSIRRVCKTVEEIRGIMEK